MKEYINQLARGSFLYKVPELNTITEIDEKVILDCENAFEFSISAEDSVKGIVYSSSENVVLENASFHGMNNTIRYTVNTKMSSYADAISGFFDIVSCSGEIQIPYNFKVARSAFDTSSGGIFNLFHFANLVQTSRDEARNLFLSERFQKVILNGDLELENLYTIIKNKTNDFEAMEEFLIAARKKNPVDYFISDTKKIYQNLDESIQESIGITKSGWGYLQLEIHTDADFIKPACTKVTSENFTGNRFELNFLIQKEKLHAGKNYANIVISSFNQKRVCEITVKNKGNRVVTPEKKIALEKLTKEYLDFRLKKIDVALWVENSNKILGRARGIDQENIYFRLVQAQIYFTQKRAEEGLWLLESVRDNVVSQSRAVEPKQRDIELYCYFLYVDSLAVQKSEYTAKVTKVVTEYYENGYDTWRILWILFYLDSSNDKNKSIKLTRIKDAYHSGCTSPIMYLEALTVMNAQPSLVRVLNNFELQVLSFGCRYKILNESLAMHITDLIGNEKVASSAFLKVLNNLYELFGTDKILTVLVIHLIRNELTGTEHFALYEKGILRGLRITRLFEFYIESMDKKEMHRLPKMVLMYFTYDSQLAYATRAYLYANVIMNERDNSDIFTLYDRMIERFGYEQMRMGHIDDNLLIIYRFILEKQLINEEMADFMGCFMFTYKVTCFEKTMKAVIVKHKELVEQISYPIINGIAFIQMYTDNCAVVFEDESGIRRKGSLHYEVEKVFEDTSLLGEVCELKQDDLNIQLYTYEQNKKRKTPHTEMADNCSMLFRSKSINEDFRKELNSWLIHYYGESETKGDFRQRFSEIDHHELMSQDAVCLIEACIGNELYEDAFDLITQYGFEKVAPVKLFKLLRHLVILYDFIQNQRLVQMCSYVFQNKKYDDKILKYMNLYFNGTNDHMYLVWKACNNFNVDNCAITERIIVQMLFTGEHSGRLTEVFKIYYHLGVENTITDGYIAYNSYLYFVKQKKANDIVFEAIEDRIRQEQDVSEICYLALLKYYSEHVQQEWFQEKKEFAQDILNHMCQEDKLFEFYRKFAGTLNMPYNMIDKTVIEYRADPAHKVEVHYLLSNEGNTEKYIEETMKCQAGGVFTKSFMLFYGDSVTYYFIEEFGNNSIKTDKYSLLCNNVNPEQIEGRFDYINDMLASKELHDMATMKKLMHGYSVSNYAGQQLFKPMQ